MRMEIVKDEVTKEAMRRAGDIWVGKDFNRGWTINLVNVKKIRMKKEEHSKLLAEQDVLIAEVKQELEQEQAEVEEYEELNAKEDMTQIKVASGDETVVLDANQEDGTTERLKRHVLLAPTPPKLVAINCEDCGRERIIKVQDAFQVKRCNVCQKKYRNQRRNEIRRMKRQQAKEQANQQTQ